MNRKLGWIPDVPDHRDLRIASPRSKTVLPTAVDLRAAAPKPYDQGLIGSCTANAVGGLWEYTALEQKQKPGVPSRLFLYYNTREAQGTVNEDSGASIRGTIKALAAKGICPETKWPYIEKKFAKRPSQAAYDFASGKLVRKYARVNQTEYDLCLQLAAGNPVAFGFSVPESFLGDEIAASGLMKMPLLNEPIDGGHAVLFMGYDAPKRLFLVRNSWGESWGQGGYFWMPFNLVLDPNWCDDFWTLTEVV